MATENRVASRCQCRSGRHFLPALISVLSFLGLFHIDDLYRESGVYSHRGYLVVAVRESCMGMAGSPQRPVSWPPVRQHIPWHVDARMHIGPRWYWEWTWWNDGYPTQRPSAVFPGLLVNWDSHPVSEWYNRSIEVHWVLLAFIASAPTVAFLPSQATDQHRTMRRLRLRPACDTESLPGMWHRNFRFPRAQGAGLSEPWGALASLRSITYMAAPL